MPKTGPKPQKKYITTLLVAMSAFCLILTLFRIRLSGNLEFIFLVWNLFLAGIPMVISSWVQRNESHRSQWLLCSVLLLLWLPFFPNSPYILTDLFHLTYRPPVPVWYDLVLILCYAWTGLVFGLASLFQVERFVCRFISPECVKGVVTITLFVTGFGIYLGRFLRWNTWDILNNPDQLFFCIGDQLLHPYDHPATWAVTVLIGLLLNMIYWTLKLFVTIQVGISPDLKTIQFSGSAKEKDYR